MEKFSFPPEGRTFLAQWGKFWTSCLDSVRRKNEPKIEIEMKFCRVLKILLDGCQKKVAWGDLTRMGISSRRLQVVCFKCKASALSWIQEKLHFHSMKHCECLQNSWQTPLHPLFLKKLVGREGKFSYDNASTHNKPVLSWYEMFPILEYIEGGPLFRTPIKFQHYCQYANK